MTPDDFWAAVRRGEPGECWPWTGAQSNGYGIVRMGKKVRTAHAVAYELAGGAALGAGEGVKLTCGNRVCCNPAHSTKAKLGHALPRRAAK